MNSSHPAQKRLIVVLGMHRSGTSALSRSLPVFRIELGDQLLPAVAGDNDKGFWEDVDVYRVNVDILGVLHAAWDSSSHLPVSEMEPGALAQMRQRGLELMKAKLSNRSVFGMKDPRFSLLLEYWQPIFRELDLRVTYLLAVRNPLSVAHSLHARNGIAHSKCYGLWLAHTLGALRGTRGEERLCVDYDEVLLEPGRQLKRIGRVLEREADETAAEEYIAQFLDQQLRHTRFFIGDLESAADTPPGICEIYSLVRHAAIDDSSQAWGAIEEYLATMTTI
jgi:hypothetical protein